MRYRITLTGADALIHHNGAAGLDTRSPAKLEIASIAKKRGTNRTEADERRLIELESLNSLYLDERGRPTFPASAVRAMIEAAARKQKQGPAVREGLLVEAVERFEYDEARYGKTAEDVARAAAFTVPVKVQQARVLRTRARFEMPWRIVARIDTDPELVDRQMLDHWLSIGGRRIGLGDWRPACSGTCGRFAAEVMPLPEEGGAAA